MGCFAARFESEMDQRQDSRISSKPGEGFGQTPISKEFQGPEPSIDLIRATVDITKEAVHAISITALEAVREGALEGRAG